MYLITVTLLAGATPLAPADLVVAHNRNFQMMIIQNKSTTNVATVGDSTVSATVGIQLPILSTIPPPPLILTPIPQAESLSDWYFFGTAGQTVTVLVIP